MNIPRSFEKIEKGKVTMLVRADYRGRITSEKVRLAREGEILEGIRFLKGRYWMPSVSIGDGKERIIIKHYYHGGLLGKLTRDIFVGKPRPFYELDILEKAREGGLPVPEAISARVERVLGPIHKGEIILREIPESVDLLEYLKSLQEKPVQQRRREKDLLTELVAKALRSMHDVGIYHKDLNIRNILVQKENSGLKVHLIDFASARVKERVNLRERVRNLARLYRSCEKWHAPLTSVDKLRFFLAYFRGDKEVEASSRKFIRRCSRIHCGHRLYWKFFG